MLFRSIETVYAPVADSRVSFYTTEWQPLTATDLYVPVTEDMFLKGEAELSQLGLSSVQSLDIFLVKYSLSVEDATLTAEYTTPQYLDEERQNEIKSLLKTNAVIYKWNSGRFE